MNLGAVSCVELGCPWPFLGTRNCEFLCVASHNPSGCAKQRKACELTAIPRPSLGMCKGTLCTSPSKHIPKCEFVRIHPLHACEFRIACKASLCTCLLRTTLAELRAKQAPRAGSLARANSPFATAELVRIHSRPLLCTRALRAKQAQARQACS